MEPGIEITTDQHYGGDTFSLVVWKCAEKSLLHSDNHQLFRTMRTLLMSTLVLVSQKERGQIFVLFQMTQSN